MTRSILHPKHSSASRLFERVLMSVIAIAVAAAVAQAVSAQCVDSPDKKSSVRFNNETRFELTFFIDDDEKGVVVASRAESTAFPVEPGEHLLRARAVVSGEIFWMWTINEIPPAQLCTWIITDPHAELWKGKTDMEPRFGRTESNDDNVMQLSRSQIRNKGERQ